MEVTGATALLVLLLAVSVSAVIRSYSSFDSTDVDVNRVHNVSVDCGESVALARTGWHCQQYLYQRAGYGYPWFDSKHSADAAHNETDVEDALDSLRHVCHIHHQSRKCLKESHIKDYCLTTTAYMYVQVDFQFICQSINEVLIHSLQCLHKKRVMAMLYFHIADRCNVTLDNIMRRYKNAYFYTLNIIPIWDQTMTPQLYCLPRTVIACIRWFVEGFCGEMTGDFVQRYLIYLQNWFREALESVGLDSNICGQGISAAMMPSRSPIPPYHTKLGTARRSQTPEPGTALDTIYGLSVEAYLHGRSGEELCTATNAFIAYQRCVLYSDDKSDGSKFNILQFAHQQLALPYHGMHCHRLEQFKACWKLLLETCGSKVRGLEQHAALLQEGCEIQSELDNGGCNWQEMLLRHYLNASRKTVWPMANQCLMNPMHLENRWYNFTSAMYDLDTVISYLLPGVEEISKTCSSQPSNRLRKLLNETLRYLQRDALEYNVLLYSHLKPKHN